MKSINILHIIDDEKFIHACELTFDLKGVRNFYVNKNSISSSIISDSDIDIIFIHFLTTKELSFFNRNKIVLPIVWMFWGADAYSMPQFFDKFIGNSTQKEYKEWLFTNKKYKELLSFIVKSNFKSLLDLRGEVKVKLKIINRFNAVVPVIPEDYKILRVKYPSIKTPLYHFNYVTSIFSEDIDRLPYNSGGNVLLGNSATITNNHIEALDRLVEIDKIGERKIIVPLTYGNNEYRSFILSRIQKYSSLNISPLKDFMEFEVYSQLVSSCEILIMNHYRQQALGNVILGLVMGCSIYLSEKSSVYNFLIQNKVKVFCIDKLKVTFDLLTSEEKEYNRMRAKELFGANAQHTKVEQLFRELKVI